MSGGGYKSMRGERSFERLSGRKRGAEDTNDKEDGA